MPPVGKWLLVQSILTTILFKLLRLVFISVQRIYWQLNGTAQKLRDARLPHNYQRSAHVYDILLRNKFCRSQLTTPNHFICIHNRFEDPQYIIHNENITLLTINQHDAVFCETKGKGIRLWRSEYGAFIRTAQITYCHRLIVVPLSTFHHLAEQIGDPRGELIFLFSSGRCGSTLLTQVMESTGRCVSLSEPDAIKIVAGQYRKFGDSAELRELARDVIRWECRPYPTMQPQPLGYFVKITSVGSVGVPLFRKLFPLSRQLFMYRDIVSVAKSTYRHSRARPARMLIYILGQLSGWFVKMILDATVNNGTDYCVRLDNDLMFGVQLAAVSTTVYLAMRRRGDDVRAVRYEDLVSRPLDMCRVILQYCHFPASLAELAVKGLEADSQRTDVIAKSNIDDIKVPDVTPKVKARLNNLLANYGLPLIGEYDTLEGTLG